MGTFLEYSYELHLVNNKPNVFSFTSLRFEQNVFIRGNLALLLVLSTGSEAQELFIFYFLFSASQNRA